MHDYEREHRKMPVTALGHVVLVREQLQIGDGQHTSETGIFLSIPEALKSWFNNNEHRRNEKSRTANGEEMQEIQLFKRQKNTATRMKAARITPSTARERDSELMAATCRP